MFINTKLFFIFGFCFKYKTILYLLIIFKKVIYLIYCKNTKQFIFK